MVDQRKLHVLVHPNEHCAKEVLLGDASFSSSPGKCNDAPYGLPIGRCDVTGNVPLATDAFPALPACWIFDCMMPAVPVKGITMGTKIKHARKATIRVDRVMMQKDLFVEIYTSLGELGTWKLFEKAKV